MAGLCRGYDEGKLAMYSIKPAVVVQVYARFSRKVLECRLTWFISVVQSHPVVAITPACCVEMSFLIAVVIPFLCVFKHFYCLGCAQDVNCIECFWICNTDVEPIGIFWCSAP